MPGKKTASVTPRKTRTARRDSYVLTAAVQVLTVPQTMAAEQISGKEKNCLVGHCIEYDGLWIVTYTSQDERFWS